jgi:hypothetical protein
MDAQELRNLQEAYMEVVENQQLNEISQKTAKSLKDKAKKSELEHRTKAYEKIKATKDIPFVSDVGRAMAQPDIDKANRRARQANLADRKLGGSGQYRYDDKGNYGKEGPAKVLATKDKKTKSNESYDLYDIILSHLLDEGYADTQEAAEAIMVNMSEEWKQSILD